MCLFVAYLHHRVFWDRSDGLKGVSHLFYTTWNIFFKQYGEVGPFCLVFSLVNPAGNVPEQQTKVSFDIAVLIQSRSESVSFECNALTQIYTWNNVMEEAYRALQSHLGASSTANDKEDNTKTVLHWKP